MWQILENTGRKIKCKKEKKYYLSRWACFAATVPRMWKKNIFDFCRKSTDFYCDSKYHEAVDNCLRQKQNRYNELVVFKLRSLALMDQMFHRLFFVENSWCDILQIQEREFRLKVPK